MLKPRSSQRLVTYFRGVLLAQEGNTLFRPESLVDSQVASSKLVRSCR